jgi:hypothetical protein
MQALRNINLSIRMKLLGSAAILLVFSALIAAVGYFQLSAAGDRAKIMYDEHLVGEAQISTMSQDVSGIELAATELTFASTSSSRTTLEQEITTLEGNYSTAFTTAKDCDFDGSNASVLAQVKTAHDAWYTALTQDVLAKVALDPTAAQAALMGTVTPLYDSTDAALTNAEQCQLSAAATEDQHGAAATTEADMILLGALLTALLLGVLVSLFLARGIVNGVKAVQATLTSMTDKCATYLENGLGALARNDLTVEVHPATHPIKKYGTDEIGQTAAVTNKMLGQLQATIESYETARAGLATTMGEVKEAADS